jgi:hypothetical protein
MLSNDDGCGWRYKPIRTPPVVEVDEEGMVRR